MMTDEATAAHRSRSVSLLVGIAFAVYAVGNLILPESLQSFLGIGYLVLVVGALAILVLLRIPRLFHVRRAWLFVAAVVASVIPGALIAAPGYGAEKVQSFMIFVLLILAAASADVSRVGQTLFMLLAVLCVGMSFAVLLNGQASATGRVTIGDLNPVGLARLTAVGLLVFPVIMLLGRRSSARVTGAFLGLVACAAGTIATGSRGPLLAAAVAVMMCVVVFLSLRVRRAGALALLAAGMVGAAGVYLVQLGGSGGLTRILESGDSGRDALYETALALALENPLGIGWGGFAEYGWQWATIDGRLYPHNILLECWLEGGVLALVGMGLMFLFAVVLSVRYARARPSVTSFLIMGGFVYALTNAMVSSDVVGNRMLWVLMALCICAPAISRRLRQSTVVVRSPSPTLFDSPRVEVRLANREI